MSILFDYFIGPSQEHRRNVDPEPCSFIGQRAGLELPVHFYMLRHGCGYKLANDPRDSGLARPRLDRAHHALHAVEPDEVQGFLAVAAH